MRGALEGKGELYVEGSRCGERS